MSNDEARNDQPGHVIENSSGPAALYLSEKVGRDFGAGQYGGWTEHIDQATRYTEEKAKEILDGALAHVAPSCKVVPA